nr:hypothetical protein [Tanacetum cinerariifolium]
MGPDIPIYPKKKIKEGMVDLQPMEEEIQAVETRDVGMEPHEEPTKPVLQAQKPPSPSPAFIKENIDVLRTMIKEHDQQAKIKATPRRLAYADPNKEAPARLLARDFSIDSISNLPWSGSQGRDNVKVINMIREGGIHKRPFKEERSGLTDEITFPAIPQNQLTDEPIILEGVIKGNQTQKMQSSDGRFFRRNISSSRNNRSSSNCGKGMKKQNCTNGFFNNKMPLVVPRHNRKDRNEKPQSGRESLWECRYLERVKGSWKEVQWHQREEQMYMIREQVLLRTKSNSGRGPNSGPVRLEKYQPGKTYRTYSPSAINVRTST